MYLNSETQRNVLGRLHFALAAQGTLFLGHAEMLLSHADRFTPLNLEAPGVPEGCRFTQRSRPLRPRRVDVRGDMVSWPALPPCASWPFGPARSPRSWSRAKTRWR